jgi:hypothetical protein
MTSMLHSGTRLPVVKAMLHGGMLLPIVHCSASYDYHESAFGVY